MHSFLVSGGGEGHCGVVLLLVTHRHPALSALRMEQVMNCT